MRHRGRGGRGALALGGLGLLLLLFGFGFVASTAQSPAAFGPEKFVRAAGAPTGKSTPSNYRAGRPIAR